MAFQLFQTGQAYMAGFDKPWFASLAAIREGVEKRGFQLLGDWPCKQFGPLPFATPSSCGGTWDYIALVRRTGPTEQIELPSRVKWVVPTAAPPGVPAPIPTVPVSGPPAAPPPAPPTVPPPTAAAPTRAVSATAPMIIGAALLALWWRSKQR